MHEIDILIVSEWKQLEEDIRNKNPRSLDISHYPYPPDSYPADLPREEYGAYRAFRHIWQEIQELCPPTMARDIETAFLLNDDFPKGDLPLPRSIYEVFGTKTAGSWEVALYVFTPENVATIGEVTQRVNLDSALAHLPSSQSITYFRDKEEFKAYCQSWLEHFNTAASSGSGIIIEYL